jgi:RNA polymerase sigma-70 factor (ECF subfamily)
MIMSADSLNPPLKAITLADFQSSDDPQKLEDFVSALYEAHREEIFRYLRSRGVRTTEARDSCQEAFLRLYTALCRGESVRNPRAWLFTVAHNFAINEAVADRSEGLTAETGGAVAAAEPDPEESLLNDENLVRLHHAISALPKQQRQFIELRTAGFRYGEIAEITGVTIGTIAQSLFRAMNRLRKALYEK